ncbi:MAG: hypothetical protein KGJ55_00965 [Gammaproteobacteria bacterium]|nr:hypothetical protein [Gammaproteobacteria bacterium]
MRLLPFALAAVLLPLTAAAGDRYRVDLIVFTNPGLAGAEQPMPVVPPATKRAIEADDRLRLTAAQITVLPAPDFALGWLWHRLQRSTEFQPLRHLSWVQVDPPARDGPRLQVQAGPTYSLMDQGVGIPLQQLDGSVALYGGDLLHIDADLTYTLADTDGTLRGWRLHELRRVKLDELHFLDGGAFGLLVRVSRVPPQ